MRRAAVLLVTLLLAACHRGPPGPTDAQRAESAKLVADARAALEPKDAERRAGLTAAMSGGTIARADLGTCPVAIDFANPLDQKTGLDRPAFDLEKMERQSRALIRVGLDFYAPADVATLPGPLWKSTETILDSAANGFPDDARRQIAEVQAPGYWDYDVTIVQHARRDAKKSGDGFTGGTFDGVAFLWSFPEHKVLCMAEVDVGLQKVGFTETQIDGKKAFDDFGVSSATELSFGVLKAAIDGLVRAGAPAPAKPEKATAPKKKHRR